MNPEQLGTGVSMSGIPLRLFLRIADCAALHTDWDFGHILELPAVASSLCIMLETISETFHMRKKWILYQHTNNLLMSEQRLYKSDAGE